MKLSTRLSILEHALGDVLERLRELPSTTELDALRRRAKQYERAMDEWRAHPPDEEQRAALLKSVLDLNVEVMRIAGPRPKTV